MKRNFAFLFVPLFLLAGCIEFESQSVTYAYDAPTDTLKIFQNYHGIFGGDATNSLSDEELRQLDSVLNSQRTFFFGNWITEISHDQLREQLNHLKEEAAKESKPDPRNSNLETLLKLLVDHVRIENGGWYIDGDGKLADDASTFTVLADDATAFRLGNFLNGSTQGSDGRRRTVATAGLPNVDLE